MPRTRRSAGSWDRGGDRGLDVVRRDRRVARRCRHRGLQVRRPATKNGAKRVEVIFLITGDCSVDPATLAASNRGHWEIENTLHWSVTSPTKKTSPWSEPHPE